MQEKTAPRNRNEQEILGYRAVLDMIHESFEYMPITANVILQLHKKLYSFLPNSFGGAFKTTSNEIDEIRSDGTVVVRFKPLISRNDTFYGIRRFRALYFCNIYKAGKFHRLLFQI